MATEITSLPVFTPSITATMQSSFVNGSIVITPSIPVVLHSSAMTGSVTVSIVNTETVGYPHPGVESLWELETEQFVTAPGIAVILPALVFESTGYDSAQGTLSLTLPMLSFVSLGSDAPMGELLLTLPALKGLFSASVNETGVLSLTIPSLQFISTGMDGATGTLTLTIPQFVWAASLYGTVEGVLTLSIPMLEGMFVSSPQSYHNMVLNIRNNALTEYDNYDFNSFCRFNDKHLGATTSKIFDLDTGTTDNGTLIDWSFRTAYLDLEQKFKKKLRQAWISYKSDGNLIVTVVYPDGTQYEYPLNAIEITENGVRVKFGKGIKSKYIALDISSVDGSTLTLDAIRLHLEKEDKLR
jgi:hypothetical protein